MDFVLEANSITVNTDLCNLGYIQPVINKYLLYNRNRDNIHRSNPLTAQQSPVNLSFAIGCKRRD